MRTFIDRQNERDAHFFQSFTRTIELIEQWVAFNMLPLTGNL